jgi:CDGSH-type Zn-finger protein
MNGPVKMDLKADMEYFFCTCGKSSDKVLCDGSHKGSRYKPEKFRVNKDGTYHLCSCKKSSELPFCDGSHSRKL